MQKQYVPITLTYGATIDLAATVRGDAIYFMTATGNCAFTMTGGVRGDTGTFFITSDATPRVMTFGSGFTSGGTFTLTASLVNFIKFTYTGSTWKEETRMYGNATGGGPGGGMPGGAQGDLLYASATDTWSNLNKNTTATRYLANTGTSNNPAWAQVALATGVSGTLPTANGGVPATRTIDIPVATLVPFPDGAANSAILAFYHDNTNHRNYGRLTSGSATQDYDWIAEIKLPTDFVSFSANALSVDIRSNDKTGNVNTISLYIAAGTVDAGVNGASLAPSANDTWETKTVSPSGAYTAGDWIHLHIHLGNDEASNTVDIARLFFTYNTR